MASTITFDKLTQVLRDIFENEDLTATPELMARMVDG